MGLKLALCCKSSLLEALKLLMLPVPHRHRTLLQPRGRLSFFPYNIKAILWLVEAFFLAVCAEGGIPCSYLSSLFHAGNFLLEVLDVVTELFDEGH